MYFFPNDLSTNLYVVAKYVAAFFHSLIHVHPHHWRRSDQSLRLECRVHPFPTKFLFMYSFGPSYYEVRPASPHYACSIPHPAFPASLCSSPVRIPVQQPRSAPFTHPHWQCSTVCSGAALPASRSPPPQPPTPVASRAFRPPPPESAAAAP